MQETSVIHSTFVIERSYPVTPERACLRFNEGTPLQGQLCTNDIGYLDIVPDRRIVFASAMVIGEKCISASLATVEFLPSEDGTDVIFTHQGAFFEGSDGPQMRETGWRKLLSRLI
jgi:uncharacterized protein YndB with AHSA1/START domain